MKQKKSNRWWFYMLGSSGGKFINRQTMCLYLPETTLIDAGNIFALPQDKLLDIENIILTHSHLDHLIDIPFLIDYSYTLRERPLKIYGLPQTLETFRKNIMNWDVWPEFGSLKLPLTEEYAIEYIELYSERQIEIDGYSILPLMSNHTVPTLSLVVKREGRGFVYTSDTHRNPRLWSLIEEDHQIKLVIVDVSFPSYMAKVAYASLHHTPQSLKEDLSLLKRKNVKVYAVHLKPAYEVEILEELQSLNRKVVPLLGKRKIKV
ncbi:MAG: MBL fold metallo-hydrolase [Aquificaceae bacterium]